MTLENIIHQSEGKKFFEALPGKVSRKFKRVIEKVGVNGMADLLFYLEQALKPLADLPALTIKEVIRAMDRERKIKKHYEGNTLTSQRGGRRSKIKPLFEDVKAMRAELPNREDLLQYTLIRIAKHHGSHAAPGSRLSLTSQWRLNKMLQAEELPVVPWREVKGILTEDEFELQALRYLSRRALDG